MKPKPDFTALFDAWAETYNEIVHAGEGEYAEVFAGYDGILSRVCGEIRRPPGTLVVDLGTGTGNLAQKALAAGYRVVGVDPSPEMRRRAAEVPGLTVLDGAFLDIPLPDASAGAVISSYAFHHLTDTEKVAAGAELARVLEPQGRVVFADTAFLDQAAKLAIHAAAKEAGHTNLLHDLESEYYTTLDVLEGVFRTNGLRIAFEQLNRYVWLMVAERRGGAGVTGRGVEQ